MADIVHIHTIQDTLPKSYKVNMKVNSVPLEMKIDTETPVSIMSEATWERKLKSLLHPKAMPISLKRLPRQHITPYGML